MGKAFYMSKEVVKGDSEVDGQTGWESVAEMAEGGAGKGMESLANEPSFGEHMAGKGGEYEGLTENEFKFVEWLEDKMDTFDEYMNVDDYDYDALNSIREEIIERISKDANDFWENQAFVRKFLNSFEERYPDFKPHCLLSFGMPATVILSDPEYYDEMVNDEDFSQWFKDGNLHDFYQTMSLTDEGKERFRKDFVESGVTSSISKQSIDAIAEGEELSEDALTDLEVIKASGSNLFEGVSLKRRISHSERLRDMNGNDRKTGKKIAEGLLKYGLLGGEEIAEIYSRELKGERYFVGVGILDVAVENRIAAKSENSDINYWSQLTLDSGRNMVGEFVFPFEDTRAVTSIALKRQKEFDFSQEPVMRLFANYFSKNEDVYTNKVAIQWYNDPKFVEALEQPTSQEIIMEAIEERNSITPYEIGHCPSLLLMLARDRSALQNMQERGLFERYEGCRDIPELGEIIEKIEKGGLSDRDIVLMYGNSYLSRQDDCFDEDGSLNVEGAQRYLRTGLPGEAVKIKPEIYRKLFDEGERTGLSEQSPKVLAEAGFSQEEILFLNACKHSMGTAYGLMVKNNRGLESIKDYFDDDGFPNSGFVNEMFEDDFIGLVYRPDLLPLLSSPAKQQFIKFYEQNAVGNEFMAFMNKDLVEDLFDASGPKPDFWLYEFKECNFDLILSQDEEHLSKMPFDEKQKIIIDMYKKLPNSDLFKELLAADYEELTVDQLNKLGGILNSLCKSNADEIANNPVSFAKSILRGYTSGDEDRLADRLEKVEEIFVHNNLPFVGKVFNTFSVIFMDNEDWRTSYSRLTNRGDLGRVPEEQKQGVLWNDLLKASVGSGNKQLREYLESLREGSVLAERLLSEDVPENEFSDDEIGILNEYAEHLDTLYSNTEQGRWEQETRSMNIFDKVRYYSLKFSAEERRQVPDIIVRSFASGLGFQSLDQLLGYMEQTVKSADARNREAALRGGFKLESGDLIKAVETEYLGDTLQNGAVCKEFLNGERDSDSTPLDADLGVLPYGMTGSIKDGVDHKNETNAFGAMHCMLVMKGDGNEGGRGRFKFESEGGEYDPWKYEVWENGGENHGVRVGFPSTEIDYIVYDRLGGDAFGDYERIKFEVVRNGLYIPIVDKDTGELVFTPEEFDRMRQDEIGGLEEYGGMPYVFADERGVVDGFSLPEFKVGDIVVPATRELVEGAARNREEVDEKRGAIIGQVILPVLEEFGLRFEDEISSNLFKGRAEVIDTGSTGRYSNAPHDGDFDFMMKLDKEIKDGARLGEIRDALLDRMNLTPEQRASAVQSGNIRATGVRVEGLDELVDIDVTFARRTAKVDYSTDMALNEYYEAMREQSPEKAAEVVANVVYAKKLLKSYNVYKPSRRDEDQGGLGGVGIENWVIQNGGSFEAAARSFMRVADECGDSFELFKEKYGVFDFGENHKMDAKAAHDNFVVGNMNAVGYGKMRVALREFLDMIDSSRS